MQKLLWWNPYHFCHFRQVTSKSMSINGKNRQEVALYLLIVQDPHNGTTEEGKKK